ncbi:hypothetical protein GOBAR_DD18064 [Gossypium barbadense]|nr:hypothetical protein GOBAR_DD18064 [Gossypium barbadense]
MEEEPAAPGKRKSPEKSDVTETPKQESAPKRRTLARTCVHEVAVPSGYVSTKDESIHGTLSNPAYNGEMAKTYQFELDPFQQVSVACLERNESVLVSAHTSAGKTAVAEYAIAMAFRDKQRVIYTSPLKALSNQKYRELHQEFNDVGLMTGDVTLSPNASCLVMTTEILRGMLYRGSEVLKEVAWVIFDEIHYMKDRERGVVWEESIIFLPPAIKMVFLSATMSNATEFAEWIFHLHKQPCHVVYTDFRPTPLQHYVFPMGGSGLYLVVDENEQFREDNFMKLQDSFVKQRPEDRCLPAIELMLPLLMRGIAVHHSGLLPVIKELVELLFQEGLIKALFATETFAMGLNMPAKTVVFTSVKKWDGDSHRYIGSGEYIQMSGRAGRRGKDERGICIIMVDEQMEMNTLKDMVLGKPAPLVSTFRLSYYSILNLMSRAEGQMTAEHVIRNSFHQFQYEKALPDIGKKVSKLEQEADLLDASGEAEVAEYHKLKLELAQLEKKLMSEITRPERVLYYLDPGRLVPVQLPLISALSKIKVSIPADLRPPEARQSLLLAVQELGTRFPQGLPKLNPVTLDIGTRALFCFMVSSSTQSIRNYPRTLDN